MAGEAQRPRNPQKSQGEYCYKNKKIKHLCITFKTIFRLVGSNGSSPIKTVEGLSAPARSSASPPKPTATKVNQGDDASTAPAPADVDVDDNDLDEFEEEERRLLALETQVLTPVSSTFLRCRLCRDTKYCCALLLRVQCGAG